MTMLGEVGPFSGNVNPVHAGVYKRKLKAPYKGMNISVVWSHWNGKWWGCYCYRYVDAAKPANANLRSVWQDLEWWGVEKP